MLINMLNYVFNVTFLSWFYLLNKFCKPEDGRTFSEFCEDCRENRSVFTVILLVVVLPFAIIYSILESLFCKCVDFVCDVCVRFLYSIFISSANCVEFAFVYVVSCFESLGSNVFTFLGEEMFGYLLEKFYVLCSELHYMLISFLFSPIRLICGYLMYPLLLFFAIFRPRDFVVGGLAERSMLWLFNISDPQNIYDFIKNSLYTIFYHYPFGDNFYENSFPTTFKTKCRFFLRLPAFVVYFYLLAPLLYVKSVVTAFVCRKANLRWLINYISIFSNERLYKFVDAIVIGLLCSLAVFLFKRSVFLCYSVIAYLLFYLTAFVRRRDVLYGSLGKNKSKFKQCKGKVEIKVVNFDPSYNFAVVQKAIVTKDVNSFYKLRGKTLVFVDKKLIKTYDVPIFNNMQLKFDVMHKGLPLSVYDLKYYDKYYYRASVFAPEKSLFNLFLNVVFEEIIKLWFPYFGVLEYCYKVALTPEIEVVLGAIFPLVMHELTLYLPSILDRILVHFIYNFLVFVAVNERYFLGMLTVQGAKDFLKSDASMKLLELSKVVELAQLVYEKKPVRFVRALAHFGYVDKVVSFLENFTLDNLVSILGLDDFTLTSSSDEKFASIVGILNSVMPPKLAASPTLLSVVKLISLLFGSMIFKNFSTYKEFIPVVDFSDVSSMEYTKVVCETFVCLYKSLKRSYDDNDIWHFFLDNKVFALKRDVCALLEKPDDEFILGADAMVEKLNLDKDNHFLTFAVRVSERKCKILKESSYISLVKSCNEALAFTSFNVEENTAAIDKIDSCISMIGKSSDDRINHMYKGLVEKRRGLRNSTIKMMPRTPPFFVVLLGNFGVGKTFLIDDAISLFCTHMGIVFEPSMRGDFHFGNKYPAEGVSEDVIIAVMNDELGDHSQDPKTDRISMMEYFRAFLDTDSLHFKQADVAKKGLVYNNIRLAIMTTNDNTFLFSEDCGKLERRFDEHGCIIDVVLLDEEMKVPLTKAAAKSLPKDYIYRRSHLSGFVCRVGYNESDPKRLNFDRRISQEPLSFGKTLKYTYQRLESHTAVCISKAKLAGHKCKSCGVQMNNHFDNGVFYPIKDGCEFYESDFSNTLMYCACGLLKDHEENPFKLCKPQRRIEQPAPILTADIVPTNFYDVTITMIWVVFWSWVCKTVSMAVITAFHDFWTKMIVHRENITLIASEFAYGFTSNYLTHVKLKALAQAHYYYNLVRTFLRDYKFLFGMIAVGGTLKVFMDFMTPKTIQTGDVILKENVDHESCMIAGYVKGEVAFPDPKKRLEWGKEGMKISKCEIGTIGTSLKDMYKMLKSRVYAMEFHFVEDPAHYETGWIVSLNASYCLINRHYVYDSNNKFRPGYFLVHVEPGNPITVVSDPQMFVCVKSSKGFQTDAMIMKNNFPFAQKDFLKFFLEEAGPVQVPISLTNDITSVNSVVEPSAPDTVLITGDWRWKRQFPEAKLGDCGNLAIGNFKGTSVILGITSYMFETVDFRGRTLYCGGPVLTLPMLCEAIKQFPEPYVSEFLLSGKLNDLTDLHPNSDLRNLHSPYVYNVGSFPNARADTFSSKIRKSPWHNETVERCDKAYGIPKDTQGVTPTNGYQSVFTQTMRHSTMVSGLEEGALERACVRFADYFIKSVDEESPGIKLSKITLEEAFLGDPSQYIDRCNFKSSIGTEERHFKNRGGLFAKIWTDESAYKFHLNAGFKAELERRLKMKIQRIIHVMSTSGSVKDEIRSAEKLLNFQLRLFYLIDVYSNTIAKMYVIPLVILLMRFPYFSKCFGGLNSGSSEWDDLYKYLVGKLGKNFLTDLDFAGFDMSHCAQMFRRVAFFFYLLAKKFYGNEEDAVVCYLVVYALCFKIFIYNGSVAFTIKGLPSGHMLTLIINSIVNMFLMLMAFEKLCPELADKFFEHVFSATVGDDNLSGLSDEVKDRFNVSTISALYKSWGYVVTNANKSVELSAFISTDDAVFLKRKFRYEESLDLYVAPLDKDSIYKMLSFVEIPSGMSETQHYSVLFDVAQREFFLHGREVFDEFVGFATKIVDKHSIFVDWKSFDQLVETFKSKDAVFMNWI